MHRPAGSSVMESVKPTRNGYFVVAYACPTSWGGYRGYFKLTGEHARYHDVRLSLVKGSGLRAHAAPFDALVDAVLAGMDIAARLPDLAECEAWHEGRPLSNIERVALRITANELEPDGPPAVAVMTAPSLAHRSLQQAAQAFAH